MLRPALSMGASGPLVRLLQKGLHKLRYAVPRNDRFDDATGRAVMAYRKVNHMARRFDADERVIRRVLAGKGISRSATRTPGTTSRPTSRSRSSR